MTNRRLMVFYNDSCLWFPVMASCNGCNIDQWIISSFLDWNNHYKHSAVSITKYLFFKLWWGLDVGNLSSYLCYVVLCDIFRACLFVCLIFLFALLCSSFLFPVFFVLFCILSSFFVVCLMWSVFLDCQFWFSPSLFSNF